MSNSNERLPRRGVASLLYADDEEGNDDNADEADDDGSSGNSERSELSGEDVDEADDPDDGCDSCGEHVRDSDRAELGDDDVDMFEQSEPRLPPLSPRRPPTLSATTAVTAAADDGSGMDSSCCRNDSMSAKGSGDSGSAETMGRKRNDGWDSMSMGVVDECDRHHSGEHGLKIEAVVGLSGGDGESGASVWLWSSEAKRPIL